MKKITIALSILLSVGCVSEIAAQLSKGGKPVSFLQAQKVQLKEIRFETLPPVQVEALKAEDVQNDKLKDQPWRFGQDIFVNFNPGNSGTWERLPQGGRIWRLGIESPGALSINLTFDNYRLPEGAELFIYSSDKKQVLGAFTSENNQDHRYFATELIRGDKVVIEYYEPDQVKFNGELNLWRITHGYRSIGDFVKAFGGSGDCNVNAICPQGDPIRDQIRSVAMTIIGGYLCTGALINNTNENGTPYFLSANHCYGDPGGAIFRFNWESETCENPASSPEFQSLTGAVDVARYEDSDMWLVEINDEPPANFNVYYSGWNRESLASIESKVWAIHHPSGDIKKISWSDAGVTTSDYLGGTGSGTTHWRVGSWSDETTTEGGSSGSPLFDDEYRIIGQLHGGYAACGNTSSDWYGKLSVSWIGGGTNETRLSNWLDPAGSGALILDGYDPNATQYNVDGKMYSIIEPGTFYTGLDSIQPSFIIQNYGLDTIAEATVYYTLNNADSTGISWTGQLLSEDKDTVVFPKMELSEGFHVLCAWILVDGDENPKNDSLVRDFTVANCDGMMLPVNEGFDSAYINPCWTEELVSGSTASLDPQVEGTNPICSPAQGPGLLEFNSYDASAGASLRLVSPAMETVGMDSITVSFDWYHDAAYGASDDRVVVQYSYDNDNWNSVESVSRYSETISGWDRKTIELPPEVNHKLQVFFGLLFISEWGNNCHMDSLVIGATNIEEPFPDFFASEVEVEIGDTVIFYDNSLNGPYLSYQWSFGEGAIPDSATGTGPINVVYETAGQKTVTLVLDDTVSLTKENYITVESLTPPDPQNLIATVDYHDVYLIWNVSTDFEDGFESGDLSNWGEMIEGPGEAGETGFPYWYVVNNSEVAYEGTHAAKVDWGYDLNTWLITPFVEITPNSQIVFVWNSSYYWHVEPYDNGDLFVKISTDGGEVWQELWTFGEIGEWETWAWYETTIDLSDFESEDEFAKLAFNVVANDNAEIVIDSVIIEENTGKRKPGTRLLKARDVKSRTEKHLSYINAPVAKGPVKRASIVDFTVYRNGAEIGKAVGESYTDPSLDEGSYTYYIEGNYIDPDGVTGPSNEVTVYVGPWDLPGRGNAELAVLYPNPSQGVFRIEVSSPYELTITDVSGTTLGEYHINSGITSIDLTDRHQGIYLLHFRNDENTFILKALIQE